MLFSKKWKQLHGIQEEKFGLEKTLQALIEDNLKEVFWLQLISSEFQRNGLRIDTLAFDPETNAFVIIEYKRDKSFSVIDQWYAYLSLMLNNKADFIVEYYEKTKTFLKKDEVSRPESRVLFVASSFTVHQRNAINFKDLPIELREAKKYQGELYNIQQIKASDKTESVKTISKDDTVSKVAKEIKQYSVDDHIKKHWTDTHALYQDLQEKIFNIDDRFDESPQKYYIWYKIGNKVVSTSKPMQSKIRFSFNRIQPWDVKDPEKKLSYQKDSMKFFNKHISDMEIYSSDDIDYAMLILKQVVKLYFS